MKATDGPGEIFCIEHFGSVAVCDERAGRSHVRGLRRKCGRAKLIIEVLVSRGRLFQFHRHHRNRVDYIFLGDYGSTSVTGSYSNVSVVAADQYGGAGGTGNYLTAQNNGSGASYSISLSKSVNYFGLWISALDSGNQLTFYNGNTQVFSFSASDLLSALNTYSDKSSYYGNPNGGGDSSEPFAFVNFYDVGSVFNRIVLSENTGGAGFESDNHTVGSYSTMSGRIVSAVPEPASWTMAIVGFGLVGCSIRWVRRSKARQLSKEG